MRRINSAPFIGSFIATLIPVAALAQVDLSPAQMQIDSTEPSPNVAVTVTNAATAGQSVPPGAQVTLYADAVGASNAIATMNTTQPLNPGQSEVLTFALGSGFAFTNASGVARSLYVVTDSNNAIAETNESNNENFAYRWRQGLNPAVPQTHRVLVVTVVGPAYSGHGPQLAQTVTWAGGTTTHMYTSSANPVAALLNGGAQFDQIWVYDLSSSNDNAYAADFDAIAAWYNTDRSRDIIADGRIIATLWRSYYTSAGRILHENYYENLRIRGGGLLLGTDHGGSGGGPTNGYGVFVDGVNRINDAVGIGRFYGNPGGATAGMQTNDPNPIRTIPNDLGAGVNSQSSPGNAPTGFQDASNIAPGGTPLQRTFYTVAWHNGSSGGGAATPAISTTIQGSLGFNVAVQAPCRVVNSGQSNVLTLNISTGAVAPLTYQWTSNISGVVSTGPTLDTATLPSGEHTINVTVQDGTGFRPGDSVLVSIDGADCNMSCIPDAEEIATGALIDAAPTNGIPDICEDADGDGITDGIDVSPCDPQVQAMGYGPAQDTLGMLMYEDLWPVQADLDFNDAVVAWNSASQMNTAGATSKLRLSLYVLAVGGDLNNGLGVQLPVAASNVQSITRSIAGGPSQSLALRGADSNATVHISGNMREFFGGQPGPINSMAGQNTPPVLVTVDVILTSPVDLGAAQPWDVFLFRAADVTHQIHMPNYAGTAEMNGGLFGTGIDGSGGGRWFVDMTGLPYALSVPQLVAYPLEGVDIAVLYPDILNFAASGGLANADFFLTNVNHAAAFGGPAWTAPALGPIPPPVIDTSCLAP